MIEEFERRSVGIADVKGAYLSAEMDEFLILEMVDEQVVAMSRTNPECSKNVLKRRIMKMLHLMLN